MSEQLDNLRQRLLDAGAPDYFLAAIQRMETAPDPNWPVRDGDDLDNAILRLTNLLVAWGNHAPKDFVHGLYDVLALLFRKRYELADAADQAWGDAFDRDRD